MIEFTTLAITKQIHVKIKVDFSMHLLKIINIVYNQGVPKAFEKGRAYNHNQICLVENFFQVVAKEIKSLYPESVSVLSIFCPKNKVIFETKKVSTLNLSLTFRISDLQGGAMAQCPLKYAAVYNFANAVP